MKRFRLLLLDANVVIELRRQGIWDQVTSTCDVYVSRTVAEAEAHFYADDEGRRVDFDVTKDVDSGRITLFDVDAPKRDVFLSRFDRVYLDKLDPGESESLAFLLNSEESCMICSADAIVYRVLGNLQRSGQGVSLEEVLQRIGLARTLAWQFSKSFREKWTKKGFDEHLCGLGLKA